MVSGAFVHDLQKKNQKRVQSRHMNLKIRSLKKKSSKQMKSLCNTFCLGWLYITVNKILRKSLALPGPCGAPKGSTNEKMHLKHPGATSEHASGKKVFSGHRFANVRKGFTFFVSLANMGPCGSGPGPCEPMWFNMGPHGATWVYMGPYGHMSAYMI